MYLNALITIAAVCAMSAMWYLAGRIDGERRERRRNYGRIVSVASEAVGIYAAAVDEALLLLPDAARVTIAGCIVTSYAARVQAERVTLATEDRGTLTIGPDGTINGGTTR